MKKKYVQLVFLPVMAALIVFQVSGCKKANPEGREDVAGKITLNGQLIDPKFTAAISFVPSDSRTVTDGGGGQIVGGKYLLTNTEGVKPGKYKVKLFVNQYYDIKTGEPSTEKTGDYDSVHISMIPPEFNDATTLEFEVVAGKKNAFDYDIVTDYVPDASTVIKRARNKPVAQ